MNPSRMQGQKIGFEYMDVEGLKKINGNKRLVKKLAKKHQPFLSSELTKECKYTTTNQIVEKAKYIYIAGFFLMVSPKSIHLVADHAAPANKVFTMYLSAPFICELFKDAQEKALPYVDYVFKNETEARTFSKVLLLMGD